MTEKNKCLVIHLSASILLAARSDSANPPCEEVWELSRMIRWEQYQQDVLRKEQLGSPTNNDPLIVAALRAHVRDILSPNRDREHKSLLCSPRRK